MVITKIRRLLEDLFRQRLEDLHTSFPAIVVSHLGPVPQPGGGQAPGILTQRMIVRPKYKKMNVANEIVVLPRLLCVPVVQYKQAVYLRRVPSVPGDEVLVVCSERELHKLVKDDEYRHAETWQIHTLSGAMVIPYGIRMDSDPQTPNEALDADYWACTLPDNTPIAKEVRTPDGRFIAYYRRWELHCPDIHLGKVNDLEAVRIRVDKDNDSEVNGPDIHPSGSKCTFISTESDYQHGLTEPVMYRGEEALQMQAQEYDPTAKRPTTLTGLLGSGKPFSLFQALDYTAAMEQEISRLSARIAYLEKAIAESREKDLVCV